MAIKNKKSFILSWTKLDPKVKKEFQKNIQLLSKINMDSLPKELKKTLATKYIKKCTNCQKLNSSINELKHELLELKIQNKKNEDIFKEKASNFSKKAKEAIAKQKKDFLDKQHSEINELKKYACSDLLVSILGPINNIRLAIGSGKEQNSQELKNYLIGFEMLINQLEQQLFNEGLSIIKPKVGDKFDPNFHSALSSINNKQYKEKIVEVKKNGYMLHDRVIIPAIIIAGK